VMLALRWKLEGAFEMGLDRGEINSAHRSIAASAQAAADQGRKTKPLTLMGSSIRHAGT